MATEASAQTGSNRSTEVAFGLDENLGAALSYIAIFGLVMLFVEEDSDFVRFHAAQAVVFSVIGFGLSIGLNIVTVVLANIPVIGAFAGLIPMVVMLATGLAWLFLVFKAYSGERFELPVVAGFAKQLEAAV